MELSKAIIDAFEISKIHPEYVLCGSVALILKGAIPPRDVHDIDFVVERNKVDGFDLMCKSYKPCMDNKEYHCFFIEENGIKYDLFVYKDDKKIEMDTISLPIQSEKDILDVKKGYSRSKDIFDLSSAEKKVGNNDWSFSFLSTLIRLKILKGSNEDYNIAIEMVSISDEKQ